MLLAIDAGNTNVVFAVVGDDGAIRGEWRASSKADSTADELGVWLSQLLQISALSRGDINAAIIATVVPPLLRPLKTMCQKYFGCDPLVVGDANVDLGLEVLLDKPDEVGADRLVNAVAAHKEFGGPLIVVDFGTATTFDVIDGEGSYCGGAIAPGINLSIEALHMAAAKLPRISVVRPPKVIGTNTVGAMQSGVFWGYIAMIEGMIDRIGKEFGADMRVVATGGLAPLFEAATDAIDLISADLTIYGLFLIHKCNTES
ncbi:MAG: type III pantothenate kinase [Rhodospirillales bacterium]|nr:type III pantothenate kinase [Rhodospirillales bacterium]